MLELGWKVPATVEGTADGAPVDGDRLGRQNRGERLKKKFPQETQPDLANPYLWRPRDRSRGLEAWSGCLGSSGCLLHT